MAMVTNTANVANREKTMIRVSCPPSAPVGVSVMLLVLGVVTVESGAVRICYTNHNRLTVISRIADYKSNCKR